MSEKVMPESLYSSATRRHVLRKRPSPSFMMLALWTAVTCLRPFLMAKSNAKRAMRSVLWRVMILSDSTTPGDDWCSSPEYSPSVFSRMMAKSTSRWRVGNPGTDLHRTTEA